MATNKENVKPEQVEKLLREIQLRMKFEDELLRSEDRALSADYYKGKYNALEDVAKMIKNILL